MQHAIVLLTSLFIFYHYYLFLKAEWHNKKEMERRRRTYPKTKVHYYKKYKS